MSEQQVRQRDSAAVFEAKPGDVFRWSWNAKRLKELTERCESTVYWCCSQFCTPDETGRLVDTYWGSYNSHNKIVRPSECDLEFLGNVGDFEPATKDAYNYYAKSDILDISHPNMSRGGVYLRKGAIKSWDVVKSRLERVIEKQRSDLKWLERKIADNEKALAAADTENTSIWE